MLKVYKRINIIYTERKWLYMIDLYKLRQFVTFTDAGTLSEAAEILHLSQPALSRNMQKLEEDLEIPLFIRHKNKLELNENGKYVLTLTKKLLEDADTLAEKAQEFDRKNRTISLGVCAPAPIWRLAPLISNLYPNIMFQTETVSDQALLDGLNNHTYHLVVVHEKPTGKQYFYKECGRESLMFALPKKHKFARRKSLTFAEMNGENMLLMSDIGFWNFVRTEMMPDSRFLTQDDRFSFNELVQASSLPSFTSDLAEKYLESTTNRIIIPISDKEATTVYYLVCRSEKKKEYNTLFSAL